MDKFLGYPRSAGRVGTRNYLAIIPTVFCANEVAMQIAAHFSEAKPLLHLKFFLRGEFSCSFAKKKSLC